MKHGPFKEHFVAFCRFRKHPATIAARCLYTPNSESYQLRHPATQGTAPGGPDPEDFRFLFRVEMHLDSITSGSSKVTQKRAMRKYDNKLNVHFYKILIIKYHKLSLNLFIYLYMWMLAKPSGHVPLFRPSPRRRRHSAAAPPNPPAPHPTAPHPSPAEALPSAAETIAALEMDETNGGLERW